MNLSSRLLRRAAFAASMALALSLVAGMVAQAHHRHSSGPQHANQLEVPLPITLPMSFFVQVLDKSIYTPTLTEGKVNIGYDLQARSSQVLVQTDEAASFCPPNRPTPVLRVALQTLTGKVSVGGHVSGKTTGLTSGNQEQFSQSVGDAGAATSGQEVQLLLICQ